MEQDPKSNLVLTEDQVEVVSNEIEYPLFITGRAGSGKSTVLQYMFVEIILRYMKNRKESLTSDILPPVYLSYSQNLINEALSLSETLLKKNHIYKDELDKLNLDYDEDINPLTQIDEALAKARRSGKFVICQVGGNWCPWCLRFADFITNDSAINSVIEQNFVYIHVNYHPRKAGEVGKALMKRLNNAGRFGFPVLVVLDEQGRIIHIQDSGLLEEDKSYNQKKVLNFFQNWTPKAVNGE